MNLRNSVLSVAAAGFVLLVSPVRAAQHAAETMMMPHSEEAAAVSMPALGTLDDLKAEIGRLRARVAILEALKPTMTTMMPDFAERFHVMHRASDDADWAVAAHELDEMTRLVEIAPLIDAKAGPLMQAFMAGHLRTLRETIEHGNKRSFDKALGETVASCNGCHAATGSKIVITLDVDEGLSLRHPHALRKSKVPKDHTH
jgi:hypothetical protein